MTLIEMVLLFETLWFNVVATVLVGLAVLGDLFYCKHNVDPSLQIKCLFQSNLIQTVVLS